MGEVLRTILTIAVIAVLVIGAIALGLKFFNTSTKEEEHQKGWDE